MRIDKFVSEKYEMSRNSAQRLIESGNVLVDGVPVLKKYIVKDDDVVTVNLPEPTSLEVTAQNLPIDIVYEDDDLLVVDKPQGMVVHPANGNPDGTLVNALLYHCQGRLSGIGGVVRPGIVHRIDKNTSGLLIVAKNDNSHILLSEQIKLHSFTREYKAVVCGVLKNNNFSIDKPIGRSTYDRKKMSISAKFCKNAVTKVEVIEKFSAHTLVKLKLETGRTHQIRVHMASIGHSVYGDYVYGKLVGGVLGQCLHAYKIGFIHPKSGEYMEFESPLPEYFNRILEKVKQ
ncbi:MAG: RluA family pseudouridine synthase [Ruminococcus sp.]|jgi:23S rRNA pseudouridine1911/1915/1917 synthase|nr:RluA family pseudouridine synthase [Ruminococcus sp.]